MNSIEDIFNATAQDIDFEKQISTNEIIVFGAGNLGRKIVQFLKQKSYKILAIADNNKALHKTKIHDVVVDAPSELAKQFNEKLWLVCIWSPNRSFVEIKTQLQNLEIKNIRHAAQLFRHFPNELLPYYYFEEKEFFKKNKDLIEQAYHALIDDESKKQFLAQLNGRVNLNFDYLPIPDIKNQYFPSDIVHLSETEVFLDAGAYNGDTLTDFISRTNGYKKIIALEPDTNNFNELISCVQQNGYQNIVCLPLAVSNENAILKFKADSSAGAVIDAEGNIEVRAVKIDDYFADEVFTFIKMDIEGAELNALKGAYSTIVKHKPKLAICIYHLPDDFWTIINYINQNFPFYNLFLRTHQYDGLDIVLYAIKKD